MRYLNGTTNYSKESNKLVGFSDSDFACDKTDRRSCSGYAFILNSGAISWSSRRQSCVALSTAEAEYMSLADASKIAIWSGRMVNELSDCSDRTDPLTMMVLC